MNYDMSMEYSNKNYDSKRDILGLIKEAIKKRDKNLNYLSDIIIPKHISKFSDLRDKHEYVIAEYKKELSKIFNFASDRLKKDKDFILKILEYDSTFFYYIKYIYGEDKDVLLKAIESNCKILNVLNYELRNDKEFMLKAIERNPDAFQYASYGLKNDKDFIIETAKYGGNIMCFISEGLKKNIDFMKKLEKIKNQTNYESLEKNIA